VHSRSFLIRQTQWDPPTWNGPDEDMMGKKEGDMDISPIPTSDEGNKKVRISF